MIGLILTGLAKANLAASVVILLVLGLRGLIRPRFGAQASYLLWLAPLAAGLAVLAPHPAARTVIAPMVQSATLAMDEFVATAPAAARAGPDVAAVLFGLWLAGALAAALLLIRRQAAFVAALGRLEAMDGEGVFRAEHVGVGPAVVGVLRPRIVAPADFETRFGPAERELILAHERVHLRRGDAAVNAIACALQCVSWFNPLVHLAARLMRIDQELACDASVIGRFPAARRTYAELLLKTQLAAQPLPLGCHWPAGSAHPLKSRIAMLKSPLPAAAMRCAGLAVVGCLTLGAGTLAWSAQPGAAPALPGGPGAAERAEALRLLALHPSYTCDPELEAKGVGCKIIAQSAWIAVPTQEDLARAYPPGAREAGQAARVRVACHATTEGLLTDCAAVDVTVQGPEGEAASQATRDAFGEAALKVTRYYQFRMPSLPKSAVRLGSARLSIDFGELRAPLKAWSGLPAPPGARHIDKTPVSFAPAPAAPSSLIAAPDWAEKPGPNDMARVYPAADKDRMGGQAVLDCRFGTDGRLTNCHVASETPPEDGFGAAALKLAPLFRARPISRDGVAVAGQAVRIPFRFLDTRSTTAALRQPEWIDKPVGADLARYYPAEAVKQNFEGMTSLSCGVDRDGRLTGCVASGITTFGVPDAIREDFRKATLELAGLFRMKPLTVDGVPTNGGRVNIPIRWSLPTDAAAAARLNALRDPGPKPPSAG